MDVEGILAGVQFSYVVEGLLEAQKFFSSSEGNFWDDEVIFRLKFFFSRAEVLWCAEGFLGALNNFPLELRIFLEH